MRSFVIKIAESSGDSLIYWDTDLGNLGGEWIDMVIKELVAQHGRKVSRHNPETTHVLMKELYLEKGKIKEKEFKKGFYQLPILALTDKVFNEESEEILAILPEPFRNFVRAEAWDRGHASGLEEVLMLTQDLTDKLQFCLEKFEINKKCGSAC